MNFYKLEIPLGFKGSAAEISGGCGSDKAWIDLVPDRFIGVDISIACKCHDYLYTIGGTKKDKLKADRMFKRNLIALVQNDHNLIFRDTNLALCKIYYEAVRGFGDSSFNFRNINK
jgi:hypothetical protein